MKKNADPKVSGLTLNWNRAIHIDDAIDEALIRRLTPDILRLRAESNEPITVGIDSPGGSLTSVDVLLGLISGPDQDGEACNIITVATNRAYSAAATLLAFGDYSIALPHSRVLYHDVRYGGIEDVTPEKARTAAKTLQDANERFAFRLADKIIGRLVWSYIDLNEKEFEATKKRTPNRYLGYARKIAGNPNYVPADEKLDIACFAASIQRLLSSESRQLIPQLMDKLAGWVAMGRIEQATPVFRKKGSRLPGILDGTLHLYLQLARKSRKPKDGLNRYQAELSLLLCVAGSLAADVNFSDGTPFPDYLDQVLRNFTLLSSMNDKKHLRSTLDLMQRYELTFFGEEIGKKLKDKTPEETNKIIAPFLPAARLFWYFCVLLCRELFEGEHVLTPKDAQLLGLVDEVSGGGLIQSRRDFWISKSLREEKKK